MLKNSNHLTHSSINSSAKWSMVPLKCALKRWAGELLSLSNQRLDADRWRLLGHGVLLQSYDIQEMIDIAPIIAKETGFEFMHYSRYEMLDEESKIFDARTYIKPTLVFLESGPWISHKDVDPDDELPEHANIDADKALIFRLKLKKFLLENAPQLPVVFVTGVKTARSVDPILRTIGCFDRKISMPEFKASTLAQIFISEMGEDLFTSELLNDQARLGALLASEYGSTNKLRLMQLAIKRLAARERRKIQFQDLLLFALYGTTEVDGEIQSIEKRTRHAVHEVGHAIMWVINSKGKIYPDYCSVICRDNSLGITAPNYQSRHETIDDRTFQEHIDLIRVRLGGRAAEHMVFGLPSISAKGSGSDLENVSREAWQLFGRHGLPTNMSCDENAASNLLVTVGNPSPSEYMQYESLARDFIAKQYLDVLSSLRTHRVIFDELVKALVDQTFLDQNSMRKVVEKTCEKFDLSFL